MMSMFEDIRRPIAEMNVINQFIEDYTKARQLYKQKKYSDALSIFEICYNTLEPINDIYPKMEVLYYLMKTKFQCKQFYQCLNIKDILLSLFSLEFENDREHYLRFSEKIFFYELIILNIFNQLNESIQKMIDVIRFINQPQYSLREKAKFFLRLITDFMKMGNLHHSKKFEIFKEEYDNMIVNNDEDIPKEKIKVKMKQTYNNFLCTKIRKSIFDEINADFFKVKYNQDSTKNKVINFLNKKMHISMRDQNTQKLKEMFETYININKFNICEDFGNIKNVDLIYEQKKRIKAFDTIYGNLCGSFKVVFGEYLTENYIDPLIEREYSMKSLKEKKNYKQMRRSISTAFSVKSNGSLKGNGALFQQIKKNKSISSQLIDLNASEGTGKYKCDEFDFEKDVYIPPNVDNEKVDKVDLRKKFFLYYKKKKKPLIKKVKILVKDKKKEKDKDKDKDKYNNFKEYEPPITESINDLLEENSIGTNKAPLSSIMNHPSKNTNLKIPSFPFRNINNYCKILISFIYNHIY